MRLSGSKDKNGDSCEKIAVVEGSGVSRHIHFFPTNTYFSQQAFNCHKARKSHKSKTLEKQKQKIRPLTEKNNNSQSRDWLGHHDGQDRGLTGYVDRTHLIILKMKSINISVLFSCVSCYQYVVTHCVLRNIDLKSRVKCN